jgi:hypothetical protein
MRTIYYLPLLIGAKEITTRMKYSVCSNHVSKRYKLGLEEVVLNRSKAAVARVDAPDPGEADFRLIALES